MPITQTSEVNPFDLYIKQQIDLKVLLYKILCGAVITLIALRLNDAVKLVTENAFEYMQRYLSIESVLLEATTQVAISVSMAILFAFAARVAMGERDLGQIFNVFD